MQHPPNTEPLESHINKEDLRILLWDIDGTLLQSTRQGGFKEYFATALEKTFGTAGDINNVKAAGSTDTQIVFQALESKGFSIEKVSARMNEFIGHLDGEMRAYVDKNADVYEILPGVREILETVTGDSRFKNALLTGNVGIGAELKLEYVGLWHYFAGMPNAFGEISHDRRELAAAAGRLFDERFNFHFEPSQFIVIGDTPFDIDCARHFGAKIVCVETGRGIERATLAAEHPDALLKDLTDTAATLKVFAGL